MVRIGKDWKGFYFKTPKTLKTLDIYLKMCYIYCMDNIVKKNKTLWVVLLIISRFIDIATTYLCVDLVGSSAEGNMITRMMITGTGFLGVIMLNLFMIGWICLFYYNDFPKKINWHWMIIALTAVFTACGILNLLTFIRIII